MIVCLRCGHKWTPRHVRPARCPKCLSKYWDKLRKKRGDQGVEASPLEVSPSEDLEEPISFEGKKVSRYCDTCGKPLHRSSWNSSTDCFYCNAPKCGARSVVMGFLRKDDYILKKVTRKFLYEEDTEDTEDTGKSIVLQRMRDRLLSQRQTPEVP